MQRNIALVGISGVGKTSFLKGAATNATFQHLTAGSAISLGRPIGQDGLRLNDIAENQRLLVSGFERLKDPQFAVVVLDGHVVVHGAGGLQAIDPWVFEALEVEAIFHLVADPAVIAANRRRDSSRVRPTLAHDELDAHQARSLEAARDIATTISVPMVVVTATQQEDFRRHIVECGAPSLFADAAGS